MSDFSCSVKGLEEPLTVGKVFEAHCVAEAKGVAATKDAATDSANEKATWPLSFNTEKAQVTGHEDPYALKLLKMELRDTQSADLEFTSYRVGPHKFETIKITDGTTTLEIPGFQFQVKSVLPPPEAQTEPPKPFGPVGPMSLSVPLSYVLIVISLLGIMSLLFAWRWKKRRDRLEVLTMVKKRTIGPTPIVQFHRELRILTKKAGVQDQQDSLKIPPQIYLKELRHLGEIFWGQKFKLALLGTQPSQLEKEFKVHAPKVYIKYENELKFWNNRWQKLNANFQKANMQDFIDLTLETRTLVEKMVEEEP